MPIYAQSGQQLARIAMSVIAPAMGGVETVVMVMLCWCCYDGDAVVV